MIKIGCMSVASRQSTALRLASKSYFSSFIPSASSLPPLPPVAPIKLKISSEVQYALNNSLPIVALESTIISHGMPYPQNKEVAMEVEEIVRSHQCTPATIAIINGECCIGLDRGQLERIADPNMNTLKASKRDIAYVCAQRLDAATTVASTMVLAHIAGIRVFCTGGIGGVHRGAEHTFDVSADLEELARTPVAVVCAGIKSILDIPKSLEVLETKGVPVVTYRSKSFPSFFTNDSGISSPMVAQDEKSIAEMIHFSSFLNFPNGMVVAVPNPAPADSEKTKFAIDEALYKANEDGIDGARLTPYILAAIEKSTGGKSLDANIALVKNNARVASNIAKELSVILSLKTTSPENSIDTLFDNVAKDDSDGVAKKDDVLWGIDRNTRSNNDVLVFGGAVVDNVATSTERMVLESSNPGYLTSSVGGVGRNIATALAKLGGDYTLGMVTCIGIDEAGAKVLRNLSSNGIDVSKIKIKDSIATATYNAIHESVSGNLIAAVADMQIFDEVDTSYIGSLEEYIEKSKLIVADGNLSIDAFKELGELCLKHGKPFYFEPTSDHKCLLPLHVKSSLSSSWSNGIQLVDFLKPNLSELIVIVKHIIDSRDRYLILPTEIDCLNVNRILSMDHNALDVDDVGKLAIVLYTAMCSAVDNYAHSKIEDKRILVSMGERGCLLIAAEIEGSAKKPRVVYFPIPKDMSGRTIVNTSGAGDCLFAGVIHQIVSHEKDVEKVVEFGLHISQQSLASSSAVPDNFHGVLPIPIANS